jgi:hypothetical protein
LKQNVVYGQAVEQSSENYRIIKINMIMASDTNDLLEADVEQLSSKINKALAKQYHSKILRVTIGNWTIISNLYYFKKVIIPTMEKKKTNTKIYYYPSGFEVLGGSLNIQYMHSSS